MFKVYEKFNELSNEKFRGNEYSLSATQLLLKVAKEHNMGYILQ